MQSHVTIRLNSMPNNIYLRFLTIDFYEYIKNFIALSSHRHPNNSNIKEKRKKRKKK